jgi:hypothetical protein
VALPGAAWAVTVSRTHAGMSRTHAGMSRTHAGKCMFTLPYVQR